ncbi:PREDICTED: zinc finger protein 367-like [Rhagoletis zephyria]|uniref:zinc finger protein 367-like n=1 Tax=Rhagoletis zephyria TaxID=28612 RepID=UPI0008116727|nr:PREDICTED: zinc finger protein 367-like [Rhagoletis zephyria]
MVEQVKEMLLPPKNDQEKPFGIVKTTSTPVKPSTSKSSMSTSTVPPSQPPKSKMIFATKSKPGPSSSAAAAQPFSGLYKRMAEEDGFYTTSTSNNSTHPNKKKAITVELQIDDHLDLENDYDDVSRDEGAGGSGDAELVNNIDIANIHLPNTSEEQQQHRPTPPGKHPCTEPNCGKHFNRSNDLKRHLRTHTKAKPFGCTFPGCSSEFSLRHHALGHILNVHLKKQKPGDDEEGNGNNTEPPDPATYLSVKEELL